MEKNKKNNVAIFLMAGPAVVMVGGFIIATAFAWIAGGLTPQSDPSSELLTEVPPLVQFFNVLAFVVGALSVMGMIAIFPCFIIGLVMFLTRRKR